MPNESPGNTDRNNPGGRGSNMPGGNPGGGGMFNTGEEGPLRLFQESLSGQASWLLPFVLLASLSFLKITRLKQMRFQSKEIIFWLAWLVPVAIFFSIAGFFHQYYLIMLAPPIAALFGAGAINMYQDYKHKKNIKGWLLPIAILITAAFQWYIIMPYDEMIGKGWSYSVLVLGILAFLVFTIVKCMKNNVLQRYGIAMLLILFIGPLYWAATPIVYGGNSMLPAAGPTTQGDMRGIGMENAGGMNEELLNYVKENNTGEEYLFATSSYNTAAPYMIDEGASVMIMNGFSGSDQVYTVEEIEELVAEGKVKYFLISERGFGRQGNDEVTEWLTENGEEITFEESSSTNSDNQSFGDNGSTLYKVTLSEGGSGNE
ncbi:4-amino-4-deoxy-L-arabinose transferase [Gracilibacillus halophilus YIM-C55.5]|uniref:4-amino-4-deoxy-L-arabinose transferase n=1 Tax=Gracilibacillus halophilus YIM-C55.5 TaxID=1308866 RepID=N4WP46_9BACI|nr:4-amino-4-deoxy-L-arabinose transferase [Gracilibacillus halophilus YIM-C55.5]